MTVVVESKIRTKKNPSIPSPVSHTRRRVLLRPPSPAHIPLRSWDFDREKKLNPRHHHLAGGGILQVERGFSRHSRTRRRKS
jgi:hypothetical protein